MVQPFVPAVFNADVDVRAVFAVFFVSRRGHGKNDFFGAVYVFFVAVLPDGIEIAHESAVRAHGARQAVGGVARVCACRGGICDRRRVFGAGTGDSGQNVSLLPVCAVPLLLPPLFELSNAVSCAFELPRNARYVRRASKKLKKARENGCIVIGITGSYGKTSVKNMLAAILGEKYRVCATPESYNTPLGIAKTLESAAFDGAQFFIAEMGAAKTGDIKELCDLFPVDYGVFTGVCRQHSETFGGVEEIFAEKKILIDRAEKKAICGAEVYADFGDKLSAEEMKKCVFVPAGAASDVGGFPLKTTFDLSLNVGGKVEKRRVEMPVLGRGAAENAALAAYAAAEIGLSADEIFKGLALAKPVPHRLQLIEENGVYVLDDGYNASEKSAAQALEVLSAFGGRKYVVTPGIVETGLEDKAVNRPLGAKLAAFDGVFIHAGAEAVKEGYLTAGGKEENLRIYRTRDEVIPLLGELLAEGDAVLFLNDVPAIY